MNTVLLATLLGGFLGIFDGLTAWFSPDVRDQMVGIVIGSTVKGLLTGVLIGVFSRKVHSIVYGTIFGLAVGAFFAYLILMMNPGPGHALNIMLPGMMMNPGPGHALNIMLPGSLVGLIVGYVAQSHNRP